MFFDRLGNQRCTNVVSVSINHVCEIRMTNQTGLRVLIVEDEPIVAMDLAEMLEGWGHTVIGPASRRALGVTLAQNEEIDFAILDVNLGRGETSEDIAAALRARGVRFMFLSAHNAATIDFRQGEDVMQKPVIITKLEDRLRAFAHTRFGQQAS